MKTKEQELKDQIRNYKLNGIAELFNNLKNTNSTLNFCDSNELLDFMSKCCKIEREIEGLRRELKGYQQAKAEFLKKLKKQIDIWCICEGQVNKCGYCEYYEELKSKLED